MYRACAMCCCERVEPSFYRGQTGGTAAALSKKPAGVGGERGGSRQKISFSRSVMPCLLQHLGSIEVPVRLESAYHSRRSKFHWEGPGSKLKVGASRCRCQLR